MSDTQSNPEGRPPIDKEEVCRKLEPYLKSGLSVNKACTEAQIPHQTVYDLMAKDSEFSARIKQYQQFLPIAYNQAMVGMVMDIITKQSKKEKVTKEEMEFMKWFGLNSNITREEYGERKKVGFFDPEAEIRRMQELAEQTGTDIDFDEGEKPTAPDEDEETE